MEQNINQHYSQASNELFNNYYYNLSQSYFPVQAMAEHHQQYYTPLPYSYIKPVVAPTATATETAASTTMYSPANLIAPSSPNESTYIKEDTESSPATPQSTKLINYTNSYYPTPPSENERSLSMNNISSGSLISSPNNQIDESSFSNQSNTEKNKPGRVTKRRSRTQYTKHQIDCLEAIFLKSHYPEVHVVDKLSDKLNLSIERISVWFQNRRAKFKKTKKPSPAGSSEALLKRDIDEIFGKDVESNTSSNASISVGNNESYVVDAAEAVKSVYPTEAVVYKSESGGNAANSSAYYNMYNQYQMPVVGMNSMYQQAYSSVSNQWYYPTPSTE